jgi:hypothetical protein
MTLIDVGKLSEPITKFLSMIESAVGTIYEPRKIRNNAEASAEAIIVEAKSKADATLIQAEAEAKSRMIDYQINERIRTLEERRQKNINNIVQNAISQLPEKIENDAHLEDDWVVEFFNLSQDISNEKMQLLWAKILAGKVVSPKDYSLRTLNLLKNLSQEEAEIFSKVGNLAIIEGERAYIYNPSHGKFLENDITIEFTEILKLQEVNLLSPNELSIQFLHKESPMVINQIYNNKLLLIEVNQETSNIEVPILMFTKFGIDLLKLLDRKNDITYLDKYASYLVRNKFKVVTGDIVGYEGKKIKYINAKEFVIDE